MLNIEKATLGYDANNIQKLLNNINTHVINEAQSALRKNVSDLRKATDEVWVGQSAIIFKDNMDFDVNVVCQALDATFKVLQSQLFTIVSKMDEDDKELLGRRS